MAYYQDSYYEREVIRDSPRDSFSEFSRVEALNGRPGYPVGHHHHKNMVSDVAYEAEVIPSYGHHRHPNNVVSEVVYESEVIPSYGHRHHGGAEVIERKEERIVYENDFEPSRRFL